jgi:uncharacterized protein DUF3313
MKKLTGFLALATMTALAGCASAPRGTTDGVDFARFNRTLAVEEVRLAPTVAADLPEAERAALARKLRVALVGALSERATVREPAPGVLRLEVTVTHIDTANPTANGISQTLLLVPVDRGGIAFDAHFFDGEGAKPLASTHEQRKGSLFDIKGNFSHYGHAISELGKWGEKLAQELEQT